MITAPAQVRAIRVSDLELFAGISIMSLCSAWVYRTPDDMCSVPSGYKTLGGIKIPDGDWDDLSTLFEICMEKTALEATP